MQTAYRMPARVLSPCVIGALMGVLIVGAAGCISAPPPKSNLIEQARQQNAIGTDLAQQFESKLRYHSDPVVNRYLDGIAAMLSATSGDPRLTGTRVAVISDSDRQWRSFGLPGRRVYFPVGLLRQLHFDNEVAAVIALEDGNILETHAIDHLNQELVTRKEKGSKPPQEAVAVDFLGPRGIFSFGFDEMKDSVGVAVSLMYGAGFDVRGLLQIWERFRSNPAHSPYSPDELEELLDFTRETISRYAPLKNPIVGTSGFQSLRKRIEEL